MAALLDELDSHGIPWGVVTNKPRWLTQPLLEALELHGRAGCVIAGDDMPRSKPHPAGIRLACQRLGIPPAETVMVGDHARDIEAGHRAGTLTLVALFGYITAGDRVTHWGADGLISEVGGIRPWLAAHNTHERRESA
jgi:phosphoglycolate phosphatase